MCFVVIGHGVQRHGGAPLFRIGPVNPCYQLTLHPSTIYTYSKFARPMSNLALLEDLADLLYLLVWGSEAMNCHVYKH